MRHISYEPTTNTYFMTKAFYEAAKEIGSDEYNQLKGIKSSSPDAKFILRQTSRNSSRRNPYKGITYKYMRRFILVMDSENLARFEAAKTYYETFYDENAEVYAYMRNWFLAHYPDHEKMVVSKLYGAETAYSLPLTVPLSC